MSSIGAPVLVTGATGNVGPTKFKGYTVHAGRDQPQDEIESDTTDHIAMHKGSALTKLRKRIGR